VPADPALAPVQVEGDTTTLGQPPADAPATSGGVTAPPAPAIPSAPAPTPPIVVFETAPPAPAASAGSETTLIVSTPGGPLVSP